jgi:hypothetical protein
MADRSPLPFNIADGNDAGGVRRGWDNRRAPFPPLFLQVRPWRCCGPLPTLMARRRVRGGCRVRGAGSRSAARSRHRGRRRRWPWPAGDHRAPGPAPALGEMPPRSAGTASRGAGGWPACFARCPGPFLLGIDNSQPRRLGHRVAARGLGACFQHLAHLPVERLDRICRVTDFPQCRAVFQEWDEPVQRPFRDRYGGYADAGIRCITPTCGLCRPRGWSGRLMPGGGRRKQSPGPGCPWPGDACCFRVSAFLRGGRGRHLTASF